jgi:beta-lactam-binding protein with PASTA domain
MTYRALLIGNSEFEADAGLNPLNAPTKDVARLHRALVDSATGLFADDNVRLVIERSSHDLLDELDTFFSAAHRDDLLLLYYSGHGLLDERNQLFLCGRNTRSDKLLRTAVSNVRINEFVEQSVARCTVIILDCCSSGMFKGGDVAAPLAGPGRYVVSSTRGAALANDAAVATGTSLFTEHLVTGLLGAAEDRDGDGYLDLREIFDYVRIKLTATTKQIPHCRFDGDAAVMLAKRSGAPMPGTTAAARAGDPTFVLSENTVTLSDVEPDEQLNPEIIEIYRLTDAEVDCAAETDAAWLTAEVHRARLTITLHPRPGHNRGKVVVRDRRSGTAQVVRVHVAVARRSSPSTPPITDDQTAVAPRPPAPSPPGADRPTRILARIPMQHATAPPDPPDADDPSDQNPGGRGRKKRWLIAVAAAVLLITATVGVLLRPDDDPSAGGPAPVPRLVGMTQADAEAAVRANGLTSRVVAAPPSPACTPGAVIAQNPPAGQPAGRDTPISITVCVASSPVPSTPATPRTTPPAKSIPVPGLGDDCTSAKAALHKVNLIGKCVTRDSVEQEGHVIGSDPRRGVPARPGSTVTVFVAARYCTVPDVVGETGGIAVSLMNEAGLAAKTKTVGSDKPVDTVIGQSRAARGRVKCGTTVTLSVSPGQTSGPTSTAPGQGG